MEELLQKIIEHHNKIMFAKAEAVTFLSNNHEALGIPEPRFGEVEFYLNALAKRRGIEEIVPTGSKQAPQQGTATDPKQPR